MNSKFTDKPKPSRVIGPRNRAVAVRTMRTMKPIFAQLNAQMSEIEALKQRLADLEHGQTTRQSAYAVPQSLAELSPRRLPPAGMTAMGAIMGQLDVKESTEELLAQLKALDA